MKKILLWHILSGLVYGSIALSTMLIENVTYTLISTVVFMVIGSVGYLYIGTKEYKQRVWIAALILVTMTLIAEFVLNPICRNLYSEHPLTSLLLFPYGGAQPLIQLGVWLAMKDIYFGVILGRIALLIPSVFTLVGAGIGKIRNS